MPSARSRLLDTRAQAIAAAVLLVDMLLFVSCRATPLAYAEPRLPHSEVAWLRAVRGKIIEIDRIERFGSGFELLPGDHEFVVTFLLRGEDFAPNVREDDVGRLDCRCRTTLEAGGRYRLELEKSVPRSQRASVTRYAHRVALFDEADDRRLIFVFDCDWR